MNRKTMIKSSIFLALLCLASVSATAAFKDSGWGVRPLGMGGAFTAVANDANAPLFNPAGLAQISQEEVTFMSAKLFTGLETVDVGLNYLGYLRPLSGAGGNIGFSWASTAAPLLYMENMYSVSYGRNITSGDAFVLSGGASVKYLTHEFTLDSRTYSDPVFARGNSARAVTGDVGIHASWPESGIALGFAGKNVTSPDVGLKNTDPVAQENVLGFAFYRERLPYIRLPYFTAACDIVSRGKDLDVRAGVETWLFDGAFALRAGGNPQAFTFGLGYELALFTNSKLVIDYAIAWPLQVEQTTGTHRFGLTLRLP